jgi:hypothetical protein
MTMNKPYVFLDPRGVGDLGLCLIVEHPTGVEYGHQCGGYLCEEKIAEGYLVPLGQREVELRIYEFFEREFHGHCYQPHNEWTKERIAGLNELLAQIPCRECSKSLSDDQEGVLELDPERIRDCVEAWIPVRSPLGRGVLTLINCD